MRFLGRVLEDEVLATAASEKGATKGEVSDATLGDDDVLKLIVDGHSAVGKVGTLGVGTDRPFGMDTLAVEGTKGKQEETLTRLEGMTDCIERAGEAVGVITTRAELTDDGDC